MIRVFHTSGDGSGWAIDEDLRQIRESLRGVVQETSLADAQVVHSPFWMGLAMHPTEVLAGRYVIAHADNPPFFYLKQPAFVRGQEEVDLWVARSREAEEQFQALGLNVVHIPYTIDPGLFYPVVHTPEEKRALRRRLGLPETKYLIANFHRDSEGRDLHTPKLQKAPELMVMTLQQLRALGVDDFHVLLAGPRRHWIRETLEREQIPFTFVGQPGVPGDDFGVNILTRPKLNELYNAADLYLVPSRWEGGPQSVMEAAACRCKILSTPLGLARDILEPASLFRSAAEGAEILAREIRESSLDATVEPQFVNWQTHHTTPVMAENLQRLYCRLARDPDFVSRTRPRRRRWSARLRQARHTLRRRILPAKKVPAVSLWHCDGGCPEADQVMAALRESLDELEIRVSSEPHPPETIVLRGWSERSATGAAVLQFVVPGTTAGPGEIPADAIMVAPAVQDVVNLRQTGCQHPAVVLPLVFPAEKNAEDVLVVEPGDLSASLRIWRALLAGRPVLYPRASAYYEQVFHAGLSYEGTEEKLRAEKCLRQNRADFQRLARPPEKETLKRSLHDLLLTLASR